MVLRCNKPTRITLGFNKRDEVIWELLPHERLMVDKSRMKLRIKSGFCDTYFKDSSLRSEWATNKLRLENIMSKLYEDTWTK